jgi:hypothetical protein
MSFPHLSLSTFSLQSFVLGELPPHASFLAYAWLTINTLFVFIVSTSAASLYAQNSHITEAIGSIQSKDQFTERSATFFQLAFLKLKAIPLGVPFYSTKQFITWGIIIKVMTFVSSFYFFLGSINKK